MHRSNKQNRNIQYSLAACYSILWYFSYHGFLVMLKSGRGKQSDKSILLNKSIFILYSTTYGNLFLFYNSAFPKRDFLICVR